jgi:hypothetical protein
MEECPPDHICQLKHTKARADAHRERHDEEIGFTCFMIGHIVVEGNHFKLEKLSLNLMYKNSVFCLPTTVGDIVIPLGCRFSSCRCFC